MKSKLEYKFRVLGDKDGRKAMLFSSSNLEDAEQFYRNYLGKIKDLEIRKVWIKR